MISSSATLFAFAMLATAGQVLSAAAGTWSYNGATGPAHWADLSPDYATCRTGKKQSPINIQSRTAELRKDPPNYQWTKLENASATNTGSTVEVDLAAAAKVNNYLTHRGTRYELQQFHLHAPSEHRVEGQYYDAELHLVSKNKEGGILVSAVFLNTQSGKQVDNEFLDAYTRRAPKSVNETVPLGTVDFGRALYAANRFNNYWTYNGSLTAPPCTEGVTWVISTQVAQISLTQYSEIKKTIGFNARYLMPPPEETAH